LNRQRALRIVLPFLLLAAGATAARSEVDMTGRWDIAWQTLPTQCLDIVQMGNALEAWECGTSEPTATGSIDPVTGDFWLTIPDVCTPGMFNHCDCGAGFSGTVLPTGDELLGEGLPSGEACSTSCFCCFCLAFPEFTETIHGLRRGTPIAIPLLGPSGTAALWMLLGLVGCWKARARFP